MNHVADIATGNTGAADVLFLIAVILAALAALIDAVDRSGREVTPIRCSPPPSPPPRSGWLVL